MLAQIGGNLWWLRQAHHRRRFKGPGEEVGSDQEKTGAYQISPNGGSPESDTKSYVQRPTSPACFPMVLSGTIKSLDGLQL
jgi:hypothetical protein